MSSILYNRVCFSVRITPHLRCSWQMTTVLEIYEPFMLKSGNSTMRSCGSFFGVRGYVGRVRENSRFLFLQFFSDCLNSLVSLHLDCQSPPCPSLDTSLTLSLIPYILSKGCAKQASHVMVPHLALGIAEGERGLWEVDVLEQVSPPPVWRPSHKASSFVRCSFDRMWCSLGRMCISLLSYLAASIQFS